MHHNIKSYNITAQVVMFSILSQLCNRWTVLDRGRCADTGKQSECLWSNMTHEGIFLVNWGYFGEGPPFQLCTANFTSWKSGYKAIIENEFSNKVVAFQEYKLCHKLVIKNASTHADRYGFRTAFSMGGQD
jgi:hypothetical protein